jgi:hypothetical protein
MDKPIDFKYAGEIIKKNLPKYQMTLQDIFWPWLRYVRDQYHLAMNSKKNQTY